MDSHPIPSHPFTLDRNRREKVMREAKELKSVAKQTLKNEKKPLKVLSSNHVFEILKRHRKKEVEELWCLALGPTLNLIAMEMIFRGTVDSCIAHPRDIFRFACLKNSSQLLIAHNHPSGDPLPSTQDIEFTRKLIKVGQWLEIPVVDHIILTKQSYFSFAESGLLNFTISSSNNPASH